MKKGLQVLCSQSFYFNPAIPADILEVHDKFKDVFFYVDVTGYLHELSAVKLDEKYLKGWMGAKPKVISEIKAHNIKLVALLNSNE